MMKEFHARAAMIDRVTLVTHHADSLFIEAECRLSEISGHNLDTTLVPARRKLSLIERLPQTGLGRFPVGGADVAGDMRVSLLEQRSEQMTADKTGGSGQENAFGLDRRPPAGQLDLRRKEDVAGQVRSAVGRSIAVEHRREVPDDRRRIDRRDREVRPDLVANAAAEADREQR